MPTSTSNTVITTRNLPWLYRVLEHIWYKQHPARYLLMPLSWLFCFIAKHRKRKQSQTAQPFSIPVIVVGNISIGGTGKTPLTLHLAELLKTHHYHPVIITRGYGGEKHQHPLQLTDSTTTTEAGDEAVLMAARKVAPVVAHPNRCSSIHHILTQANQTPCDVIISDDGLQHYNMHRDIEIAVIDASRGLGNQNCLPAGPLREKPDRLDECDIVVWNQTSSHADENHMHSNAYGMQLLGNYLSNIVTEETLDIEAFKQHFKERTIHALTGIGNPERFQQTINDHAIPLHSFHAFPDHHAFTRHDIESISSQDLIIMTEKDAVKCKKFGFEHIWFLPIHAQLSPIHSQTTFEHAVLRLLAQAKKEKHG